MKIERLAVPPGGKGFDLRKLSTDDTEGIKSKQDAESRLAKGIQRLSELQEVLYADDRYAVLLIFQALDAAGKDGTIKHVMSGVNPQGCQVYAFKGPSAEELDHDFMWRAMMRMPERGRIGIHNRSYYEEVLAVRVHPEFLAKQKLPPYRPEQIWKQRFEDINHIERYLVHNGVLPIKFFLHISKQEQLQRFLKRLERKDKNWKISPTDFQERGRWEEYMDVFEDMLRHTSTEHAPWYVIPADHKWYARAAVSEIITERLEQLDLEFPKVSKQQRTALRELRGRLLAEAKEGK